MIAAGGPIPDPAAGARQGVIDPVDVAAVAAEVLTGEGHAGQTYTLTGPQLLTLDEQAEILSRLLDRPISTVDLPLAAAREQLFAAGRSTAAADIAMTGVAWVRTGHNAVVTDDVERLLGASADRLRVLGAGPSGGSARGRMTPGRRPDRRHRSTVDPSCTGRPSPSLAVR
ncbi:hypothetical protein UA75_05855 [Actinoalloteichus sp. GBA129-24]|uniref:Uncharacterized protein n=1 Tax=Actinoalloteichus fjordicus TaxID=1612552 RepID=A0AAC9LBF2_9PSEU|nr:hypothetical protein UA74_05850 [Actinoalloteichus fjordicus]APU19195.1 hypothetical protein UA75_05855 [Actinoalloteichus sp. GBA129-24]